MTSKQELKAAFLAYLGRERIERQRQFDLFSSGTLTLHKHGMDITAKTLEQINDEIARVDALIAKLEKVADT